MKRLWSRRKSLYSNCSELPITLFFKIVESGDLRHLVIRGKFPDSYLRDTWDNITKEYERLTGTDAFSSEVIKSIVGARKMNRLTGLISAYYLLLYQDPTAVESLRYWGITNPTLQNVEMKIKQEKTRLNIEAVQLANNRTESKSLDFEQIVIQVEGVLNQMGLRHGELNVSNMSVKKWCYLNKEIEKKAEQISKEIGKKAEQIKK